MVTKLKQKRELRMNSITINEKDKQIIEPNKEALIIALIFGIFGFLWVTLSDELVYMIVTDISQYKQLQTFKGWLFILINIGLVFFLVRKRSIITKKHMQGMSGAYEELRSTYEELLATEEELNNQKNFNEKIFMESHVIIGTWNEQGHITRLNPFAQRLFGYTEDEVLNKKWMDLFITEENKKNMINDFDRIRNGQQFKNHESRFLAKDKKNIDIIWNSSLLTYQNKQSEILSVGIDITERKVLEEKLKKIAYVDTLTNLSNRTLIANEVEHLIKRKHCFAIVHMDIDNFKQINDTLGYAIGDQYLQYIAARLCKIVKAPNKIARLNADEFAIILIDRFSLQDIEEDLASIRKGIDRSWEINGHEFFISMSFGIAIHPKDGSDQTILFRNADIAKNRAKLEGKDRHIFYSDEILIDKVESIKLANLLQYAINNGELVLYYQPQFNLQTGEICGLEALVRWIHPEKGFISPAEFIPIAEETGQIYAIEKWVFESALNQKLIFEKVGKNEINISINLSSKAFTSEINFYELEVLLASYDVDYSHITIEITETAIISDIEFAVKKINKLRQLGMKIALDDFGTGYSSLTYLKCLPIDTLKLDKDFIKDIGRNYKDDMIIKAILNLSQDLAYEVIAEGIETEAQLEYLKKYKCSAGQGYLMSKAIPIEEVYQTINCIYKSSDG